MPEVLERQSVVSAQQVQDRAVEDAKHNAEMAERFQRLIQGERVVEPENTVSNNNETEVSQMPVWSASQETSFRSLNDIYDYIDSQDFTNEKMSETELSLPTRQTLQFLSEEQENKFEEKDEYKKSVSSYLSKKVVIAIIVAAITIVSAILMIVANTQRITALENDIVILTNELASLQGQVDEVDSKIESATSQDVIIKFAGENGMIYLN